MARARNIKPGFFLNEYLVELPYETRLLFIGLWTIADRSGRLDDRPKKIKMQLFPADNLDINDMLNQLEKAGFITRYSVDDVSYIQIVTFEKHQNPHVNEAKSIIPAPEQHSTSTVQAPEQHSTNPADSHDSLNTDSLNTEEPEKPKPKKSQIPEFMSDVTEQTYRDFKELRKAKKSPITERAMQGIRNEAEKAGITLENALIECCSRGWAGFKAEWLTNNSGNNRLRLVQQQDRTEYNKQQTEIARKRLFGDLAGQYEEKDVTP